jgi:endonuclease/exonuclease/phosphatase family metal-dependent hydrolase
VAADVVALQEADAPSRWSGDFDHISYLAEESGFPCFVHGRHSISWISSYGTALLSRSRPGEAESVRFSPSWPSKQKGFVFATFEGPVDRQRASVTVVSVHFDFLRASVRDQQVSELVSRLTEVDGPIVLMGDLNSEWGQGQSHVRALADELNLHAFSPENDGLGTYKDPTGKRLDWILISQELEFRTYEVLPNVVADHLAVVAEIAHRGQHEGGEPATSQD